jgi:hypothetical protein
VYRLAFALALTGAFSAHAAEPTGAGIAEEIRDAALDPDSCFRVRDLNFTKEDIKFYLGDGYVIFARPVLGQRLFAVFTAETEGGDAEVILMPPHRSERRSLASFTDSPNLDEHFTTAMFLFSDGTGDELYSRATESGRKSLELGSLMKDRWNSLAHNISSGFEVRLVQDVLSPDRGAGVFFAAVAGMKLGNFDIVHDPWNSEQILVGQYSTRGAIPSFDIWTAFESRSIRTGRRAPPKPRFNLGDYRIEATLGSDLHMQAITRARLNVVQDTRALGLHVSSRVRITSVSLDGKPVEVYDRESLRDTAIRGSGNSVFVAITPEPLAAGSSHEIEIHHEGDVVAPAGNGVYYVTSRGNWYPRSGLDFAAFDLTFRYPKNLTLVATGDLVDDRVEGDVRITRRTTSVPVRVAGFNLGQYEHVRLPRNGFAVEVFGNRKLEPGLQPKAPVLVLPPQVRLGRGGRTPELLEAPPPPPPINPSSHLSALAETVAGAFEFMRAEYGPSPIKLLTVSPIPGAFGQGFPGLVYLSTIAYLRSEERPSVVRNKSDDIFFTDLLAAHEVAHQWWGNSVAPAGYQDEWLMEALANYASLLYMEKRRGTKVLEEQLALYQSHLLHKQEDGRTIESVGPITLGLRLQSSQSEAAWRTITYEKGAWIIHMLRRRMGDERFHKMLAEVCRRYARHTITTEEFRKVAEQMMDPKAGTEPLGDFFESWVYGTGIPALKLNWSVKGKAPALRVVGTVTQSGVEQDFATDVPVEVLTAKGAPVTVWVRTSNEPVSFSLALKQPPVRVAIPAGSSVLATRN